jgi:hypothetical protein
VQDSFDSIWTGVAAKEHWRFVSFQNQGLAPGGILLAGAVKPLDRGARMTAPGPFIVGPELEPGQSWVLLDGVYSRHELVDVNAIDQGCGLDRHRLVSFLDIAHKIYPEYIITISQKSYFGLNWA